MTINEQRILLITQKLEAAFSPCQIDVIDESHLHAGHAGAQSGLGHFALSICARSFSGLSAVQIQRQIYAALGNMMQTDIHALRIIKANAD